MILSFFPWIFALIFIPIILIQYYFWVKRTGWRFLSNQYPLPKNVIEKGNPRFFYGQANIGGVYKRNTVFSTMNSQGVFIRKPFPFSIIMSSIFIPWSGIEHVIIHIRLDGKPHSKISKLAEKLPQNRYAKIEMSVNKENVIIIPWRESFEKLIPQEKIIWGKPAGA